MNKHPESSKLALLSKIKNERSASACVCCASTHLAKSPAILMPFVAHRALGWQPVKIDESWGLNTILQGQAYSICNSVLCQDCGFLFLDIRFSESELAALYDDYRGDAYVALRDHYEPGYQERNQKLLQGESYIPLVEAFIRPHVQLPVRMLDWGGDTGKNSPFKQECSLFHIYDISHKPVIAGAESVDLEVAYNTAYDLIVSSSVIEHVPYPTELILQMKQAMQAQTRLYIEVPYEPLMRSSNPHAVHHDKKHWHEHINFFTPSSLARLIELCGLKVIHQDVLKQARHGGEIQMLQVLCQL